MDEPDEALRLKALSVEQDLRSLSRMLSRGGSPGWGSDLMAMADSLHMLALSLTQECR